MADMAAANPPPATGQKRKADAMELSENAATRRARVIELLPNADVTLKVGQRSKALDIKVSSTVLCLASKVFNTMLNSPFVEASSKVIDLKEDDPRVILDFCYIIHHQHDRVKHIDVKLVRGLITLADMRDCRGALKLWLSSVLEEYIRHVNLGATGDIELFCNLSKKFPTSITGPLIADIIAFAYVFELYDPFWRATELYLAETRGGLNSTQNICFL